MPGGVFPSIIRGRAEEPMIDFGMLLATTFGGVLGGAIGFLILAFVAAILAFPYLMMSQRRRSTGPHDNVPDRY
jgi:hypothetical protein